MKKFAQHVLVFILLALATLAAGCLVNLLTARPSLAANPIPIAIWDVTNNTQAVEFTPKSATDKTCVFVINRRGTSLACFNK